MFLILACMLATAASAPAIYDQRQDGELNVQTDIENVLLLVAIPQKMHLPLDLLEEFLKNGKRQGNSVLQERADVHAMKAFVEPSTPYRVEIGTGERSAEGDGRAVEVVIAGRRHLDPESQVDGDEFKLLGAMEQCGPDRERDPVTLTCRPRAEPETSVDSEPQPDEKDDNVASQPTPEVVPS